MPPWRDVVFGSWRAVLVLGVTEIAAWGALFYPPVLTVPLIAADHGWSFAFTMGGFSLGLLAAGLISPRVGAAIDRHGGHRVMPLGSLTGALALAPPETQLLLLSGSVANPQDIVAWLRRIGRDAILISHAERPVPLEQVGEGR